MTKIRVYGISQGNASLARVTAGVCEGLRAHNALSAFVPADAVDEYADYEGSHAEIGLVVGQPIHITKLTSMGVHQERLFMLAPNSTWMPAEMFRTVLRQNTTSILTPSKWGASILKNYTEQPVEVYKHGVSQEFVANEADAEALRKSFKTGSFHVAHLSSSVYERKGTRELVEAWVSLMRKKTLGSDPILRLMVPRQATSDMLMTVEEIAEGDGAIVRTVMVAPNRDLSEGSTSKFYRQHHVICQPSRGEGFGLCPLESRASGVPVVMTSCTGHSEHYVPTQPGVVHVDTGSLEPIDDGPGATAPSLSAESVATALETAYGTWPALAEGAFMAAGGIRDRWSWPNVTGEWLRARKR